MSLYAAFYKGTRPGLPGIYNSVVRGWERGPYSHVELVFSDGIAASSSYSDHGVRFKQIEFDPDKWDIIELPMWLEPAARQWFIDHEGNDYDLLGQLHFLFLPYKGNPLDWWCSESVAEALGIKDSWRYGPNELYCILLAISKCFFHSQYPVGQIT